MSITPISIVAPVQLTAAPVQYYTSSSIRTRIDKATFTNTDIANAHTVTIYIVPHGVAASAENAITTQRSIAATETWNGTDLVGHILPALSSIWAAASAGNTVTMAISGVQIS